MKKIREEKNSKDVDRIDSDLPFDRGGLAADTSPTYVNILSPSDVPIVSRVNLDWLEENRKLGENVAAASEVEKEVDRLHELLIEEYGAMAATGGEPFDEGEESR